MSAFNNYSWIQTELSGLYGANVIREMDEIIGLYAWYDGSAQLWDVADGLDYKPTRICTNLIKKLIKEEARFMLSRTPEMRIVPDDAKDTASADACEDWLGKLLDGTRFETKLVKGGRDCFIGKRVAIKLTGSANEPINVSFHSSLEFVFETDEADAGKLTKIIFFYQTTSDETDRARQRVWRQKFWLENGRCLLHEALYDGYGNVMQTMHDGIDTGLDFIPAYVVINDGLTGDVTGESDVSELK
ncbi:MAG: phage portal protein, partial [Clostridia bacterium]